MSAKLTICESVISAIIRSPSFFSIIALPPLVGVQGMANSPGEPSFPQLLKASVLRKYGTHLQAVIRLCDAEPANFVLKRGTL